MGMHQLLAPLLIALLILGVALPVWSASAEVDPALRALLRQGDREAEAGAVAVRLRRGEDLKTRPLPELIERMQSEVANRE